LILPKFIYVLPVAVAQSSSDGNAYVNTRHFGIKTVRHR